MRSLLTLLTALLTACGGGGDTASVAQYQTRMVVRTSTIMPVTGFNASITFPPDTDMMASIAKQVAMPGDIALTNIDFANIDQWLGIANTYPQVKWVYVYDELFWRGGRIQIGLDDKEVSVVARQVQRAGLKSAVSIMPDVVMHPDFTLTDPNAFSVIALDLYPSLGLGGGTHGCSHDANQFTTLLACSVQKLRRLGFTGDIWYVYQAFGRSDDPNLLAELKLQALTIQAAPALGITGLVAFGYFLDALAPPLYPGKGSAFESLIAQ